MSRCAMNRVGGADTAAGKVKTEVETEAATAAIVYSVQRRRAAIVAVSRKAVRASENAIKSSAGRWNRRAPVFSHEPQARQPDPRDLSRPHQRQPAMARSRVAVAPPGI